MNLLKRTIALVLIILNLCVCAFAESSDFSDTAKFLVDTVAEPNVGMVGGEWTVLGLARSGAAVPDGYFEGYISRAEDYVKERGGVLSENKYTEYSRVIIALTALGVDPRSFAGYDLTAPLSDAEKTVRQGINGAIYALIALDCGGYSGGREEYISEILSLRLADGGFSLSGDIPDADVTATALQALSKYTDRADVSAAVKAAVECLSKIQDADGGYSSGGVKTSESCAQVLTALCELGIDVNDSRFVKNGNTVLDALLSYRTADGGFEHTHGGGVSLMSAEQACYALADLERVRGGKTSLYNMSATSPLPDAEKTTKAIMQLRENLISAYEKYVELIGE